MTQLKGMNDAEVYYKLYGTLIQTIPFYFDRFTPVAIQEENFKDGLPVCGPVVR